MRRLERFSLPVSELLDGVVGQVHDDASVIGADRHAAGPLQRRVFGVDRVERLAPDGHDLDVGPRLLHPGDHDPPVGVAHQAADPALPW